MNDSKQTDSSTKITATQLSLPKGGGAIQGIGETFQANEFTGTAALSIPIPTSPCRGFAPQLSVEYSSGSGNGTFGLGFALAIPNISRKTSKAVPKYDETDTFLISSAEDLVPQKEDIKTVDETKYTVITYRPRVEGLFAKIEQWINQETEDSYWRTVSQDNVTSIFGKSKEARIFDPDCPSHVFQWLLSETFDSKGNYVVYEYKSENTDNVPNGISEQNRQQTAKKYLERIQYGSDSPLSEGQDLDKVDWHFEVVFDYGEHNINPSNSNPHAAARKWACRPDPFSTYNAGFEIRTYRLCRNILMFHRFKELGEDPILVHATQFNYQETQTVSLLKSVQSTGYRYEAGKYETKSLPPVEFDYTAFAPEDSRFQPLVQSNGQDLPGLNLPPDYLSIDLYGEGIPGVLYSDGKTTLYWEPKGDKSTPNPSQKGGDAGAVNYGSPKVLENFPIERQLQDGSRTLMDIAGDGRMALVVISSGTRGYYQYDPDGDTWVSWQPFEAFPTDYQNPDNQMVDVTGDGLADILLVESDRLRIYPNQGEKGYGNPLIHPRENDVPMNKNGDIEEVLRFADIFGTGKQHLVRITNGRVECWPNLGYGKFGKKVQLGNAPRFEERLDASRLFIVDIDGSGTADIVYVYSDRIQIWFNQSGNQFSKPITVTLPSCWDQLNQINFADVLGNGTTGLVFSENHPQPKHCYYDFCGQEKPYLLNHICNNLGAESRITYASSTQFYLQDKRQGTPWITKLPFPVLVVQKVESFDLISQTKLVSTYSYHHGYYDRIEREFRGFGRVDRQDAEIFSGETAPINIPPVQTKTWYHTGAYQPNHQLSRQYKHEYFSGDTAAYAFPDSIFDDQSNPSDPRTQRGACRAFVGLVLRQEVYALDQSNLSQNPYTVTETNYCVRLLQPPKGKQDGVYFSFPLETLTYHYERNPQDPRIQHDFVLAVTQFGNVEKACSVVYGRRSPKDANVIVYPEQQTLKATVQLGQFIEETADFRLIGMPYEQKALELNGLKLKPQQAYFSLDVIRQQVDEALKHEVVYGTEFSSQDQLEARLLSWGESYFWNTAQTDVLPLGKVTAQALMHHHQQATFSEQWRQVVYGDKLDPAFISHEGGYFKDSQTSYWWNKGLVQHYLGTEGFYLPVETRNDFAKEANQIDGLQIKTVVAYDIHHLVLVKTESYLTETEKHTESEKHVVTVDIDYQTLSPWRLTDINGNIHQACFDPLGQVIATSMFKEKSGDRPRIGDGDLQDYKIKPDANFEDILAHPADYLQNASTFFYYNLNAWIDKEKPYQPPCAISLVRQTHVSDLAPDEESVIQISLGYSDGFGRSLEEKALVEPGEAIQWDDHGNLRRDQQGQPIQAETDNRWMVSGRTVYNNKGKATKQYLPYFSNTPRYENQQAIVQEDLVPPPTVIHYDPLLSGT